jgi:hypothetical protein
MVGGGSLLLEFVECEAEHKGFRWKELARGAPQARAPQPGVVPARRATQQRLSGLVSVCKTPTAHGEWFERRGRREIAGDYVTGFPRR